jgi:hypothetical protein
MTVDRHPTVQDRVDAVDSAARAALIQHALEVIEADGAHRLSIRRLAREANYSSSAVGYWVRPWEIFVDDVWREATSRMTRGCVHPHLGASDCASRSAAAILDWADASPRLATFCCTYTPTAFRRLDEHELRSMFSVGPGDPTIDPEIAPWVHWFTRSSQAAIALALSLDDRAQAISWLDQHIRTDTALLYNIVHSRHHVS